MIQKLAKLGALVPEEMFPSNPLGLKLDYETDDVVFIKFDHKSGKWLYRGIEIEEFSKSKADKYLVWTSRGNYTPPFPSFTVYNFNDLLYDEEINFEKSKIGNESFEASKNIRMMRFRELLKNWLRIKG